ncbi:MAG: DUF2325 domain-containing protein [Gammaproteobacteria bacterium]|nr:DUF2325 domain-containing protein [Gammaproteobacteria bacterium]
MCINLKTLTADVKPSTNIIHLDARQTRRKKVWQLERRFHCGIAGTCFTLDEMRRFCRKAQINTKEPVSDYELHINFVTMLGDAQAARPAAKFLDRKYKKTIQHFMQANDSEQLHRLWNEAISQGEVAAAFWSILTHPQTSEILLFEVYGEVHMLSHLSGSSVRIDMQALTQLRQRLPRLKKEVTQSRMALLNRTRQKNEMIEALNKRLNKVLQSEKQLLEAKAKITLLENGDMIRHLRSQVEAYACKLNSANIRADRAEENAAKQKRFAETAHTKNMHIESQLLMRSAEQSALEIALENTLSIQQGFRGKNNACQKKIDLDGRSILYVGGRNRLCTHFRTLVEQQNGHFIHHDGGREESPQRLDALLSQADAVLCPIDCVSHEAVHRIKRECKRYGKYLMLLSQSSLSAFTKGVHEYSRVSSVA